MLRSCGCCTPTLILLKKGMPPNFPAFPYLIGCVSWVEKWLSRLGLHLSYLKSRPGEEKGQLEHGAEYRHGQVDSHSVLILIFGCCILKIFFSLSHIELECLCLKTFVSSALCLNTFVNSALC